MNKEKERLIGKAIRSEQIATALLSDEENDMVNRGARLVASILDHKRHPITFELPAGAEDAVVDEVERQIPGYTKALDKWAKLFQQTFGKKKF